MYRIQHHLFQIDFLFDHQPFKFVTTYLTANKNIKVLEGVQNKHFFKLQDAIENNSVRKVFLTKLLNVYSIHDPMYTFIGKEIQYIEKNSAEKIKQAILDSDKYPLLAKKIRYEAQLTKGLRTLSKERKDNGNKEIDSAKVVSLLFGFMDKEDTFLMHSDILSLALINYLKYYFFLHKADVEKQKQQLELAEARVQKYFEGSPLFDAVKQEIGEVLKANKPKPK